MNAQTIAQLVELRRRLTGVLVCVAVVFGVAYFFKAELFEFLAAPLLASSPNLVFTAVPELFFTYLKLSFLTGVFVAFPFFLIQLWRFIAPGLYDNEARGILPFLVMTPLLFYAGGAFMHSVVMPLAVNFFFSFQTESISALPSVQKYFTFYIKMVFAFGIAFNLPILVLLLAVSGAVSPDSLRAARRYVVLAIVVAAAVLTPPDPISQMLLAAPMYLLYEVAILMTALFTRKRVTAS